MKSISFFTPINYKKTQSYSELAISTLSNYFYLGGIQATVVKENQVELVDGKISWHLIAIKVISYVAFFPITLPLLAINLALRYQHQFTLIRARESTIRDCAYQSTSKISSPLDPLSNLVDSVGKWLGYKPLWHTFASKSPLFKRSDHVADPTLLQFLINDYVGGGSGHVQDRGFDFFKHYLDRYLESWPEDAQAAQIGEKLNNYIYETHPSIPLASAAHDILKQLEAKKYICLGGGFLDGDKGGHGLFYELILNSQGNITFQITNSGSGLEFHPQYDNNTRYRTLIFPDVSLSKLKESQFIELLLSLKRERAPLQKLDGIISPFPPHLCNIHDLYVSLLHGWPGNGSFLATNPGKAQRGKSCSLQALMKWFKGSCDPMHHSWLKLWIKLSAFSDYIDNHLEPSSQFIADAVRKLSSQIDKMDQQYPIPSQLFEEWKDLSQRALKKQKEAACTELEKRAKTAVTSRITGLGLDQYEILKVEQRDLNTKKEDLGSYTYPHAFPGEEAPLAEHLQLSKKHFASVFDEMAYRMNLARTLPFCTKWNLQNKETLENLGKLTALFFYSAQTFSTTHVPDSFFVDLLNVWMGVYLAAKREKSVPQKVLFEWIRGASLLINSYTDEFLFDSPQTRKKWAELSDLIRSEERSLKSVLGESYEPPPNYWTVWDRIFYEKCYRFEPKEVDWDPFGVKFSCEFGLSSYKDVPEMARFATSIVETYESPVAKKIQEAYGNRNPESIRKAVDSFGCKLPTVPYYDVLKEGLASLFVLADKHLSKKYKTRPKYDGDLIKVWPSERWLLDRCGLEWNYPRIWSNATKTTRFTNPKAKPECIVPKTEAKWTDVEDLNQRIKEVLLEEQQQYPFRLPEEEHELIAFVQKAEITRIPEMLIFFRKCLHNLSTTPYQRVFEHLLFSAKGGENLERLFCSKDAAIPLLFEFFETSYDTLLKSNPKEQASAAFLFSSHLRLFQMSCFYNHPDKDLHEKQLFIAFDALVNESQKNPILGKALGEALFATLPTLEFVYPTLLKHKDFLELLTTSCLLECVPGDFTQTPYSELELQYGWSSFNALLDRYPERVSALWKNAAEKVFGKEESSKCTWDRASGHLHLKTLTVDVASRNILNDEANMRLIPKEYRNYFFETVFGNRNFFSFRRQEKNITIYAFDFENDSYELRVEEKGLHIYKKFGNDFYRLSRDSLSQSLEYDQYALWQKENRYLLEEKKSRKTIAAGSIDQLNRVIDGKEQKELLSSFNTKKPTFLSTIFNQLNYSYLVWADPKSQSIQSIEVPSLNLEFIQDKNKMHCKNFPGFYLSVDQHVTFLKGFKGAILLENEMGRKKVIAPLLAFKKFNNDPYKEIKAASSTGFRPTNNQSYITFDLTNETSEPIFSPHPRNQIATSWLVSLYLHTHQYRKALDLLNETNLLLQKHLSPITEKIVENAAENTNDTHPHAIALRLKLRAWALKWQDDERKDKEWIEDLNLYKNLVNTMGIFALSPAEFPIGFRESLNLRQEVLNTKDLDHPYRNSVYVANLFSQELRKKMVDASKEPSVDTLCLHVSGEDFILNFFHFYQIMLDGSEIEKNKLRQRLYFASFDQSSLISSLSDFLLDVDSSKEKTDLFAMFQLDDEAFKSQCIEYIGRLDRNKAVSFPSFREGPIAFKTDGKPQTTTPRKASYGNMFQPMFPIPFETPSEPLPFASLEGDLVDIEKRDLSTDIETVNKLSVWATDKTLSRLKKGALLLSQEYQGATNTKEIIKNSEELKDAALNRYNKEIETRTNSLKIKEQAILSRANNLHNQHQLHFEIGRELRDPLDIETLLISLGRKDLSVIRNSNPSLSNQEITFLMQEVAEYAYLRGDLQQLKRAKKSLEEGSEEYFTHARVKRCYDPAKSPDLLVFEVLSNLVLRKEQIEALEKLTPNTLFEARTGFGKSKVLLPLWLLLTAQTDLAICISPANLFESQERYLQELLRKGFHFFAIPIEFSRKRNETVDEITFIKEQMIKAEMLRRPILMSDQTAHNLFVLKLKELSQDPTKKETFEALLDLRKYVRKGRVYIDEPHKVLDDRQEFNYSMGSQKTIDAKRLDFEIDLYKHLFGIIENRYQLECFPNKNLPFLTEDTYRRTILPSLLDRMFQATPVEKQYLLGALELKEQQAFEENLTGVRGAFIRYLHDQLHYFLPQTLQRDCDAHYGLSDIDGMRIAIPLEDARNPRENNEFVSIDQLLNFTIQANLKTPFSENYIKKYLHKLSIRASKESEKENKTLKGTKAYKTFVLLTKKMVPQPSGLLVLKPDEIKRIQEHLNQNIEAKMLFIREEILPNVRTFEEKVSSSPHLLVHCFNKGIVGSSGTLSMQHFPYTSQIKADEKSMAQTVIALLKENDPIVELGRAESRYPIASLQKAFPDASVMIEVGALLRHYPSIDHIADELLKAYPHFDGVASFDKNGHPVVLTKNSMHWIPEELTGIPRSKLFWFYGQKDITGRDEKLSEKAIATVLVDEHTTLTSFIQGVGRMRGILKGQKAKIAIDQETSIKIRKTLDKPTGLITLLDIISYCAKQEEANNGFANFRSLSLQHDALIENSLWDAILEGSLDAGKVKEFITTSTKDDPLLRPSMTLSPVDTSYALEKLISAFKKKIEQITFWKPNLTKMEKASKLIQNHMPYPEKVYLNHHLDAKQVIETTSAQETTTHHETHTIAADLTETISTQFSWASFVKDKEPLPHLNKIIPHSLADVFSHPSLEKYRAVFTKIPLHISENALCTFKGDSIQQPGFLNGYMKPLHYIAKLTSGPYVLIDTQEAEAILTNPKSVDQLWLLNHGPLILNTKETSEYKKMELQANLLTGDLKLAEKEQALFNKIFSSQESILLKSFVSDVLQLSRKSA